MPTYITEHKVTSAVALIVLLALIYWGYNTFAKSATPTTYVTADVTTGTIVSSVSGSGQVSATTQVVLKPQSSGTIVYVGVRQGQKVSKGALLIKLDTTTADKAVRDAQANLTAAQISYQQALSSSSNGITAARDNGFDTATAAYSDLSSATQGLNTILLGTTVGYGGQSNLTAYADLIAPYEPTVQFAAQAAHASYQAAVDAYNQSFATYQKASRTSSPADVQTLLQSTNDAVTKANQASKDTLTFLDLVQTTLNTHNDLKIPPSLASQIPTVSSYTTKMGTDNSNVLSALTTLQNATVSLAGATDSTPLAVQTAQLNLTKALNALQDAKDNLADYSLYAPFDGTVATFTAIVGADSSSANVTMIGSQESAVLSLDEVDAAKVKLGQKATLTFDAIPDLTLTGTVTGVDTIGTVSQGVVSYDVTITMDSQDERVKPGMTVSAAIITDTAVDVLIVPSSAVKTANGASYVQVLSSTTTPPQNVPVTTGISDDTDTQIISGLTEGQQVVTRTNTGTAAATTARPTTTTGGAARTGGGANVLRGL